MKIITTPSEMQAWSRERLIAGERIACVPTMGYLHEGHLSLVRRARTAADRVVLTLFVNPTQFGPGEDYAIYPRDPGRDRALCEAEGVDVIFMPTAAEMYAPDASTAVVEEALSRRLCGASRPGHFRGVCTVVSKLFNCVRPDVAVFGQKDAQQALVIKRMVRDLNFPIEIIVAPIVREPDGLALSSRNVRLSAEERKSALGLSRALGMAREAFARGERDAATVRRRIEEELAASGLRTDYVEIVDTGTMEPVAQLAPGVLVALAAFAGQTRLIDNCEL
ncbi:MAG: pantoate--beta-alanine ligase [Lentisphaerae bacterium]|jgi:pantoate--beta-alanine ligase|nr:pantoate--beta-alanine ligase [Lentisphaerota bacterium]